MLSHGGVCCTGEARVSLTAGDWATDKSAVSCYLCLVAQIPQRCVGCIDSRGC